VGAQAFLSDKGDAHLRLEGSYDQRITQRLILQPAAEVNIAAQNVPELGIGSGITDIELGLRVRYEIAREFAPMLVSTGSGSWATRPTMRARQVSGCRRPAWSWACVSGSDARHLSDRADAVRLLQNVKQPFALGQRCVAC
jgi:uncharacterized protein involved in copper resistance